MSETPLVDWAPTLRLMLLALVAALLPLSWVWLKQRGKDLRSRLAALTAVTLFLTFDLVVFGAFTRLSDSGLGCPDWPGCYGEMSPFHARDDIRAAESAMPGGPVTWGKAWIEMIHRYLAMTVGVLILVMCAAAWKERRPAPLAAPSPTLPLAAPSPTLPLAAPSPTLPFSPWWPTVTLVWVVVQGLFGKYTVTLKLYPAIVTLHLLGGLLLLALLAWQHVAFKQQPLELAPRARALVWAGLVVLVVQIALGGWVSTNYAVLACLGFPQCSGQWWPEMDVANGFTFLRELGRTGAGEPLQREALVAIHMAHRAFAVVATGVLGWLAWRLWAADDASTRRFGLGLALLLALQLASGLSNVVLGWPRAAALGHSAGAAALVLVMSLLLARSAPRVARQALPRISALAHHRHG
jgi:heme a synthase